MPDRPKGRVRKHGMTKGRKTMGSRIGQRRDAAKSEGGQAYLQRRNEILATSASLFKERGHQGVNLGDIASALGTDRASLYYYFSSRDELFREIVRSSIEVNVSQAEFVAQSQGSAPEKIRALLTSLMKSYEENYPFLYVFIQEDLNRITDDSSWSDEVKELSHRYDEAVVGIIQQGIDEGTLAPVAPARIIAFGLIGMINWTHRWFRPGGKTDASSISSAFSDILLNGLKAST